MSERGSFCTQYIYCGKCLEVAKNVFMGENADLLSQQLNYNGNDLPIIAGMIRGLYSGQELIDFESLYVRELEHTLCCNMVVTVMPENEECARIFNVEPWSIYLAREDVEL
jgi:hypothetical protein